MAIRKSRPYRFAPAGLSDTLDGTDAFEGACSILANLVPDAGTEHVWVPRPAAVKQTSFAGFTTPGYVSAGYIIGSRFYGLIASGRNLGHDEPFCYDLLAGSFVTISGITLANTPTSPSSSGDWEPPTMALVGTKLVVTHPGFNFAGGYAFGWFETSDPSAVSWNAGNTTGALLLPARASVVAQYGGRAWFLVNPVTGQPGAYFTDILLLNITNTGQVLTFDDNKALTAAVGLPLENQLGGIIQSLIVFKGTDNMYQITGDFTAGTLAKNTMNVATGTKSPRTIAVTPKGIGFLSPDGARLIDFNARISDPIGVGGAGVNIPFLNSLYPSRAAAGSNASVYRVTVQDGSAPGSPTYEYWLDFVRGKWSGPHTLPYDLVLPYNNTFIAVPRTITASLWQTDVTVTTTASYTENGVALQCTMNSSLLPDTGEMCEHAIVETAIEITLPILPNYVTIQALDEDYSPIVPAVTLSATGTGASYWGSMVWGTGLWYGTSVKLKSVRVPWAQPIVFKRMSINLQFNASQNIRIGAVNLRYQSLGYLQQ